jgi:quercetin dioxygenase-like cupin family protein
VAFWNLGALKLEEFKPGIMSKAEIGNNLIMVCMEIGAGKEDTGHRYPFDQRAIVIKGKIEMFIGKERKLLKPNESYFIPSGGQHGWKTLDNPAKVLDISLKQRGK